MNRRQKLGHGTHGEQKHTRQAKTLTPVKKKFYGIFYKGFLNILIYLRPSPGLSPVCETDQ